MAGRAGGAEEACIVRLIPIEIRKRQKCSLQNPFRATVRSVYSEVPLSSLICRNLESFDTQMVSFRLTGGGALRRKWDYCGSFRDSGPAIRKIRLHFEVAALELLEIRHNPAPNLSDSFADFADQSQNSRTCLDSHICQPDPTPDGEINGRTAIKVPKMA